MKHPARFWLLLGTLSASLACFGYLFLSFLFPAEALFATSSELRVSVLTLALLAVSVFTWIALIRPETTTEFPIERE